MVDSVNLYAANLYGKIQNQPIIPSNETTTTSEVKANTFQDLVKVNFNNFAKLSPAEILDRIGSVRQTHETRSPAVKLDIASNITSELNSLRNALTHQETQAQKASIGKANLVELMTATTQARNLLDTIVALKEEFKNAWDKISNMSV